MNLLLSVVLYRTGLLFFVHFVMLLFSFSNVHTDECLVFFTILSCSACYIYSVFLCSIPVGLLGVLLTYTIINYF